MKCEIPFLEEVADGSNFEFNDSNIEKMFGHEAAEREKVTRLKSYYLKKNDYESVKSNSSLKIVVGFKGTGKSAVMKVCYQEDVEEKIPCLWIRPDDVSELYEEILSAKDNLKMITLWKKGLARLIASRLAENIVLSDSHDKDLIVKWAEDSGYRQKDLISQLTSKFKPIYEKYIQVKTENIDEIGEHHILQRLLKKQEIRIYIDDLDRGWAASPTDRLRISTLLNALGDLTSDIDGLIARISLRTDVYTLVRQTEEFTDKFDGSTVWCKWTNHDILVALFVRVYSFFDIPVDTNAVRQLEQHEIWTRLGLVFEDRFRDTRIWNNAPIYRVLMSLVRRRPRDIVKICTLSARSAHNREAKKISGHDMHSMLDDYSADRMTDIINEFRSEFSNIKELLYRMGPTSKEITTKKNDRYKYTTQELFEKIKNVNQNIDLKFPNSSSVFDIHSVAHFLYKIGFITARKDIEGKKYRVYYEDNKQLLTKSAGDMGYAWEIHPAYRSTLFKHSKDSLNWEETINEFGNEIEG